MKHFRTAWQHIRRSPYQAISVILVMSLTFLVMATFFLLAAGSQTLLNWFETRPQITTFFKDGTKTEQIEGLKAKLEQTGKIAQMKYVSKEEALSIYREDNKNDPLLLEMVTANILPASLEISAKDLNSLGEIAQTLKSESIVQEVVFQEDVVSSLSSFISALRKIGIGLISYMAIISFMVVLVIIGMKIALRREEIETLRLIGASPWYIRAPFILEGMFYGLCGAILAWLLTYIVLLYSTPFLVSFLAGIPVLPVSPIFMLILLGLLILAGILIGVVGSLFAVFRFLR